MTGSEDEDLEGEDKEVFDMSVFSTIYSFFLTFLLYVLFFFTAICDIGVSVTVRLPPV